MTTSLFLLRSKENHFTLEELDQLSTGEVFDVFTEIDNDSAQYDRVPTQADFDNF